MRNKIIVFALLLLVSLSFVFLNVSKTNAQSEEVDDDSWDVYLEYHTYDDDVYDALIYKRPIQLFVGINRITRFIADENTVANPYESLLVDVKVTNLDIDIVYKDDVTSGLPIGYYINFKRLGFAFDAWNNAIFTSNEINAPLTNWFDTLTETQLTSLSVYTGYDVNSVLVGNNPILNNEALTVEQTLITFAFSYDIIPTQLQVGSNVVDSYVLRCNFVSYTTDDNVLWDIYTDVPFNFVAPDYVYASSNWPQLIDGYWDYPFPYEDYKFYSPMAYFVQRQQNYNNSYTKGYDKGNKDGYRLGYDKGYEAGLTHNNGVDFTSWISTAIGGFLSFEVAPGLSLMSILSFIISLGLLFLILRFFSGG